MSNHVNKRMDTGSSDSLQCRGRVFLDEVFATEAGEIDERHCFDFRVLHHPQYLQQLLDEAVYSLVNAEDPAEMSASSLRNEVNYLRGLLAQQDFYLRHLLKQREGAQ